MTYLSDSKLDRLVDSALDEVLEEGWGKTIFRRVKGTSTKVKPSKRQARKGVTDAGRRSATAAFKRKVKPKAARGKYPVPKRRPGASGPRRP